MLTGVLVVGEPAADLEAVVGLGRNTPARREPPWPRRAGGPGPTNQTFFWYERNVTTETATQATARISRPPLRTPIAPQSG